MNVAAILEADLCGSTEMKARDSQPHRAVRITELHNAIVKEQLPPKAFTLKELGDAVIAIFEEREASLATAQRIQQAFNLHNLLFSAHRLHTKIAIVYVEAEELFLTRSEAIGIEKQLKRVPVRDYLGIAMDRVARVLSLAEPDEILISDEVVRHLKRGSSQTQGLFEYLPLNQVDPSRGRFLRGIGEVTIGRLNWRKFPIELSTSLHLDYAREAIAQFRFNLIDGHLQPRDKRLHSCTRSAILEAGIKLAEPHVPEIRTDVLLIGQSLKGWAQSLGGIPLIDRLKKDRMRVGVVKMAGHAASQVRYTTPGRARANEIERSIEAGDEQFLTALNAAKQRRAHQVLQVKHAPGLLEDTWAFFTDTANELFETDALRLPYSTIANAYLDTNEGENPFPATVEKLRSKYRGNLPIEWCVHDILFGASAEEALSIVFAMDWLYAILEPEKSQYLMARRKCNHIFNSCREASLLGAA